MILKLPIVAVTHAQGEKLASALFDLGWHERKPNNRCTRTNIWARLLDQDPQLTHIWLSDGWMNPRSLWTCGPRRSLANTLADTDYNLTLLNSPAHMLAYVKTHWPV